jgi:aspartate-semialdehyde dehydrogenase
MDPIFRRSGASSSAMRRLGEHAMLATMTARTELSRLANQLLWREQAYIAGKWRAAANGGTFAVIDPANGATLGHAPAMGAAETDLAIAAAQRAFPRWRALLPQERARILRRWFDLIAASRDDLAIIMTLEQGKPLDEARGEIDYAASFVEWYAEEGKRANVEGITSHLADAELSLRREPLGVAALVTPWNFPAAMITRKAAAALAAGCTIVVHPSSETPFSALALAELAERAGLPTGVLNVVTGEAPPIVAALCASPTVRALSFTGSTRVGRIIAAQCAPSMKRLVLELGGHAPFLVFADADPERTIAHCLAAKFATSGQDCLAANRIYVERAVYADFTARFASGVAALRVGPGLAPGSEIGPLINQAAVAKMEAQIADALARGTRLVGGGARHRLGGNFFQPTVLADVPADALIMREETFGPVAALTPFDDEVEAIARANDSEYGLVAYVHTSDAARAARLVRALDYGMVAVNRTKITGPPVPFGGCKQSGLGREGSRLGLEAFTELKYVCIDAA